PAPRLPLLAGGTAAPVCAAGHGNVRGRRAALALAVRRGTDRLDARSVDLSHARCRQRIRRVGPGARSDRTHPAPAYRLHRGRWPRVPGWTMAGLQLRRIRPLGRVSRPPACREAANQDLDGRRIEAPVGRGWTNAFFPART